MDEYLCATVKGNPGEAEAAFKGRLTAFWTHMLRARPDDYEKVYAEATKFEADAGVVTRQYMVQTDGVAGLLAELTAAGLAYDPPEEDETYSKYEATSPDWFQLEH